MRKIIDYISYEFRLGEDIAISLKSIIVTILIFTITRYILRISKNIIVGRLNEESSYKFKSVFTFFNYFVYVIVILITFDNIGINLTAFFAASTALLVGVGLALQTFIQDIISGIFIIADQAVHVGDIVEVEGKVGRVENIKLRTTRAVTIDNKVLIIPNHKFMSSTLYNWTENGTITREFVKVGVSYGSDVEKVTEILENIAKKHPMVLKNPSPKVIFHDFGESSLDFGLYFTLSNSFFARDVKSAIRYSIYSDFKENNIEIPFPQRTLWINKK